MVAAVGTGEALLVDSVAFLLSALMLAMVRFPASLLTTRKLSAGSFASDTWEGIRFCFGRSELLTTMILFFSMNLFLSPVNAIVPVYSRDTFGAGPEGFA